MITVTQYKDQAVGVFGLGKAGEATIASLLAGGAVVYAWDDGEASIAKAQETFGDKIHLEHFSKWPWGQMKAIVLSPGVPLTHPKPHLVVSSARNHSCPVIGDIELLFHACPNATYVGITGTNGKSTTTTLVGHILKHAGITCEVGGNLGAAALSLEPLNKGGVYVLELSSYQLDLVHSTRFRIGALLNVTPDHLDRHGSMQGYINAKMHLFERQKAQDIAIIGTDDTHTHELAMRLKKEVNQRVVEISTHTHPDHGIYVDKGILHDGDKQFDISGIQTLTGRHNWQNAAVAYAIAHGVGVPSEVIYEAMKTFAGLRHRMQLVATVHGVKFINDSKATNADATQNALAPYDTIYWIAGGKPKAGGIASLKPYFSHVKHAFLIGQAEDDFAKTLDGHVPFMRCGTLKDAFMHAAAKAFSDKLPNAVVLLSPACASFDQWKSFEERGDAFCAMAEALAHSFKGVH